MTKPMTSTSAGIAAVRRALGERQSPPSPRPAIYPARAAQSPESEREQFLEEIRKLTGSAQNINPAGIAQALASLVGAESIRKATLWHSAWFESLGVESALRGLGVEIVPASAGKHALAQCDLGITSADYLLPETGTLVLRSSAEQPRVTSLLPRIHLALVRPEMLRPDLHQVFAEAKDSRYLVFITGPSRTADIELTVTIGVHGPKNLHVWMVQE